MTVYFFEFLIHRTTQLNALMGAHGRPISMQHHVNSSLKYAEIDRRNGFFELQLKLQSSCTGTARTTPRRSCMELNLIAQASIAASPHIESHRMRLPLWRGKKLSNQRLNRWTDVHREELLADQTLLA